MAFLVLALSLAGGPALHAELPAVHRIDILGSNAFLLETASALFLIDAGYPRNERPILEAVARLGKPLKLIVATHGHFDHYGSAAAVRRATGCLIAAHVADAESLALGKTPLPEVSFAGFWGRLLLPLLERILPPEPTPVDIVLHDGDTLSPYGLEARILHTPGHTPGSLSVLVEDRLLFVGDLIATFPAVSKQSVYASDWEQIKESIRQLVEHEFREVYPGHGAAVPTKAELVKLLEE